jgi:hypothetical protein
MSYSVVAKSCNSKNANGVKNAEEKSIVSGTQEGVRGKTLGSTTKQL